MTIHNYFFDNFKYLKNIGVNPTTKVVGQCWCISNLFDPEIMMNQPTNTTI